MLCVALVQNTFFHFNFKKFLMVSLKMTECLYQNWTADNQSYQEIDK